MIYERMTSFQLGSLCSVELTGVQTVVQDVENVFGRRWRHKEKNFDTSQEGWLGVAWTSHLLLSSRWNNAIPPAVRHSDYARPDYERSTSCWKSEPTSSAGRRNDFEATAWRKMRAQSVIRSSPPHSTGNYIDLMFPCVLRVWYNFTDLIKRN